MTEEQKEARRANLARAREARLVRLASARTEGDVGEEIFPAQTVVVGEAEPQDEFIPPPPLTPFGRFLETLDPETRDLLDEAELRVIFDEQQAKARAERRVEIKKAAQAQALEAARIAEGVIPPKDAAALARERRLKEKVRITVDLPEMGDIGLRMDQHIFLHGHTYTVTRAQFESMQSMIYQAQQGELAFEGKDRSHWLRRRARGSVNGHIDLGGHA